MKIWKKDYYEKQFMERKQTVQDYELIIAHAQEKIEEIRQNCKHYSRGEKIVRGNHGGAILTVCNDCGIRLD